MNDQMLKEIEEQINSPSVIHAEVSMQDILRNADQGDLAYQRNQYGDVLTLEVNKTTDALRHRAAMMRLRADEFDQMADGLEKLYRQTMDRNIHITTDIETMYDVLQEHAHIEPTKV